MKVIKYLAVKGKNKRALIELMEYKNNEHAFFVHTKSLADLKTRNIVTTNTVYSVETFFLLKDMFSRFTENPEIANKTLSKEVNKMHKFKGQSNF